jgi:hypothetical protein
MLFGNKSVKWEFWCYEWRGLAFFMRVANAGVLASALQTRTSWAIKGNAGARERGDFVIAGIDRAIVRVFEICYICIG